MATATEAPSDASGAKLEEQQALLEIQERKRELLEEIFNLKNEIESVGKQIQSLEEKEAARKIEQERSQQKQERFGKENAAPSATDGSKPVSAEEAEKKVLLMQGKKKFNIAPQKGIDFLVEKSLLENSKESIAQLLLRDSDGILDKTMIGEYLGDGKPFNISVLKVYVEMQDFLSMSFEKALRKFLAGFRLPGEAQKIDRMMEQFAHRFCANNPGVFASPDTAYVLAFSTIMLNTDLHNPAVKNKIAKLAFIKNNKGINEGGDLPERLLSDIYDSILKDEIKMDEEANKNDTSYAFFNPERDGFMVKQGGRIKTWKRRWFVLTGNCLYYFKDQNDASPCGIIPLENLDVKPLGESSTIDKVYKYRFTLSFSESGVQSTIKAAKTGSDGKVVQGRHENYLFASNSEDDMNDWMLKIRANMSKPPMYTLLQAKKEKVQQKKPASNPADMQSDDDI